MASNTPETILNHPQTQIRHPSALPNPPLMVGVSHRRRIPSSYWKHPILLRPCTTSNCEQLNDAIKQFQYRNSIINRGITVEGIIAVDNSSQLKTGGFIAMDDSSQRKSGGFIAMDDMAE